ncbi:hypothetical protein CLV63_10846 [Murinocardiopsis flavida]|uniref:Uncharacterized protein n=1 Tax=Murinocardiopsis flavida TaxID=645275 RepID=A0A2P8DJG8_9ACTN|nr:hypothetical protein CLV63_10846 [Murinocardiopsis flavida]
MTPAGGPRSGAKAGPTTPGTPRISGAGASRTAVRVRADWYIPVLPSPVPVGTSVGPRAQRGPTPLHAPHR